MNKIEESEREDTCAHFLGSHEDFQGFSASNMAAEDDDDGGQEWPHRTLTAQ